MTILFTALTAETWAMEPRHLRALLDQASMPPPDAAPVARDPLGYRNIDGVAHIPLHGVMMKSVPPLLRAFGVNATSTLELRAAVREALVDDAVRSILLRVDSPGGSVNGLQDLADDIHAAREIKPVHAAVTDQAASAAYWIASQASHVSANQTAHVGNIGVVITIQDSSAAAERDGVKVHVVSSGPFKGMDTAGAPVTPEHLAYTQETVDALTSVFVGAVARGRGMDEAKARAIATGRSWFAPEAQALGLIDSIESIEAAQARALAAVTTPAPAAEGNDMPPNEKTPGDRTAELEAKLAEYERQASLSRAKEEASATAFDELCAKQRASIIDDGRKAGRVTPTMLATVEKVAAACGANLDELKAFVAGLPVQSHAAVVGSSSPADGPANPNAREWTHGDRLAFAAFDRDPDSVAQTARIKSIRLGAGTAVLDDGTTVPLSKLVSRS